LETENLSLEKYNALLNAINKSQGVIEFNLDGNIINANDNFLELMNYSLNDIKGKHHSIFCENSYSKSEDYSKFWEKLRSGLFNSGEFKRLGKNGKEVYIQATYNPILNSKGIPTKILKIASDVTEQKRRELQIARQSEMIMEMSTPIMQLFDNILLLPVIGLVDSKRVQIIMEEVLQKILDYQAKILILDIQGVPAVDSAVANHLIKITKATRLMGCTCIVTGISPEISQALVSLGIDLGDIETQSTLKEGVRKSISNLELKIN